MQLEQLSTNHVFTAFGIFILIAVLSVLFSDNNNAVADEPQSSAITIQCYDGVLYYKDTSFIFYEMNTTNSIKCN